MKIDLTKDEWEFLVYQLNCNNDILTFMNDSEYISDKILEKLGSKWIDEEEEMRKFTMGFAYKPKKDDHERKTYNLLD